MFFSRGTPTDPESITGVHVPDDRAGASPATFDWRIPPSDGQYLLQVFTFLKARGLNVGSSLVEEDKVRDPFLLLYHSQA